MQARSIALVRVVSSHEDSSIFALFAAAAETRPRLFTGRLIASSRRSSSSLVGFPRESLLEEGWKNDAEKRMVRRERECERKRRVGYFHYLVCLIPERASGIDSFSGILPSAAAPFASSHRTAPCLRVFKSPVVRESVRTEIGIYLDCNIRFATL